MNTLYIKYTQPIFMLKRAILQKYLTLIEIIAVRKEDEVLLLKKDFFGFFIFYVLYSTLIHLPPLRFHCVGGCRNRTQDCCDYGIGCQTL